MCRKYLCEDPDKDGACTAGEGMQHAARQPTGCIALQKSRLFNFPPCHFFNVLFFRNALRMQGVRPSGWKKDAEWGKKCWLERWGGVPFPKTAKKRPQQLGGSFSAKHSRGIKQRILRALFTKKYRPSPDLPGSFQPTPPHAIGSLAGSSWQEAKGEKRERTC